MRRSDFFVIGVTGGVGAGKSEILKYLATHYKSRIIYTDVVANEIKLRGQPCFAPIVDLLGEAVLGDDGEIDKGKMAKRIFQDDALLAQVNAILHPEVYTYVTDAIREEEAAGSIEFMFIEAALLIEAGYGKIVDEMWYVHADEAVRRKRLKASRGYDDARIDGILKGQLSEEAFRADSDFVIDNSGDLTDACAMVAEHIEVLRKGKEE